MDIAHLIAHPEELNQETLYDLRRIVAVYPTYHAARILFLQNLFLLHDPTFDQELRRAALLVPDRRVLYNITQPLEQAYEASAKAAETPEAAAVPAVTAPEATAVPETATVPEASAAPKTATVPEPATVPEASAEVAPAARPAARTPRKKYASNDSTSRLLDGFLATTSTPLQRRPIKADPASDYMAYIMENNEPFGDDSVSTTKGDRTTSLIDNFINSYTEEGIKLSEEPEVPEEITTETDISSDPTLTETLALVYIQQQKYDRAIEVLTKSQPKAQRSNPYLADQVRFLQKLAINERHKNQRASQEPKKETNNK